MTPISQARIRAYFEQADQATTSRGKGRPLEDLIDYVFSTIPGIGRPQRNEFNVFETEEIDLAFWNDKHVQGLPFLDYIIAVECKNWSAPVSSIEVSWFITKLRNMGLTFGIMIAANGVTGNAREQTEAHSLIYNARAQQLRLIVITRQELEQLQDTTDLVNLIKVKLTKLTISARLFG
ncbi:MAG: restriction endonuclease [Chloroflexota bacterium]|nr:restriction endonuclease [Chloroflexota bacterium]MDQ5866920.1 restriction endonuclease [Chloroflexota bacterium]